MTHLILHDTLTPAVTKAYNESGRGEIGIHKGLKRSESCVIVTSFSPNLFKYINNLVDIISVGTFLINRNGVTKP